jgi:hypothetical protein
MSFTTLVQTLFHLCQRGDLGVFKVANFNEWDEQPISPVLLDLEAALSGTLDFSYVLTTQGGRRWEEVSKPDWSRYTFIGGSEMMFINAGDRRIAEEYLELYPHLTGDIIIVADSVEWEVMQPWRATYWKTIPVGYRIRFRTTSKKLEPSPDWVHERWSALSKWYTNYLEK